MYRQVPNFITLARLGLAIIFFVLLNTPDENTFIWHMQVAFVVFLVAVFTDMLDGYLARRWKVESAFGRVVDPFVDKILICGAFIYFSSNDFINVAALATPRESPAKILSATVNLTGVHPWMAVVIIAREFLVTSIRGLAESRGIDFRADWAGKFKMVIQSIAVATVIFDLGLLGRVPWIHLTRDIAIWTTVIVTVLSATNYVLRARRLLSDE